MNHRADIIINITRSIYICTTWLLHKRWRQ